MAGLTSNSSIQEARIRGRDMNLRQACMTSTYTESLIQRHKHINKYCNPPHTHKEKNKRKNWRFFFSFFLFYPVAFSSGKDKIDSLLLLNKTNKQVISFSCVKDGVQEGIYQNDIRIAFTFVRNSITLNSQLMSLSDFGSQIIVHKHNLNIGKRF